MIGYSTAYQVAGISMLFYEPVTKMLLAKFGNLTDVGVYEMASRVTAQFRSLITASQQSILPLAAEARERGRDAVACLYEKSVKAMAKILLPTLAILVSSAPLISVLWLGSFNRQFIHLLVVLALTIGLQTFTGPAYFTLLGVGSATWIAGGNLIIGVANVLYSVPLAHFQGTRGVVAGAVAALLTGSTLIIVRFHMSYSIPWAILAPPRDSYYLTLLTAAIFVEIGIEMLYPTSPFGAAMPWVGALIVTILVAAIMLKGTSATLLDPRIKSSDYAQ
jgi:O-antigen/teichoic acid export membrane protein